MRGWLIQQAGHHRTRTRTETTGSAFRWRGQDVSRVENLVDAAFGFAITLLVAAQQVPRSFAELMDDVHGFPAFMVCFFMLASIWYNHFIFFRHYGLRDRYTVRLSLMLLVVVLFFVYPIKFLVTLLLSIYFHLRVRQDNHFVVITDVQFSQLMIIYSAGLAAIFALFALMYAHAYRLRTTLQLSPQEMFDTRVKMLAYTGVCVVSLLSIALASGGNGRSAFRAGEVYMVIPLVGILEMVAMRVYRSRNIQVASPSPASLEADS